MEKAEEEKFKGYTEYWAWLRKKLRKMDLDDLLAKRPAIQRAGLKTRVRALVNQRNLRVS